MMGTVVVTVRGCPAAALNRRQANFGWLLDHRARAAWVSQRQPQGGISATTEQLAQKTPQPPTVGIDGEGDGDLGHAAGRGRDACMEGAAGRAQKLRFGMQSGGAGRRESGGTRAVAVPPDNPLPKPAHCPWTVASES